MEIASRPGEVQQTMSFDDLLPEAIRRKLDRWADL
jgi:hypothetical protein